MDAPPIPLSAPPLSTALDASPALDVHAEMARELLLSLRLRATALSAAMGFGTVFLGTLFAYLHFAPGQGVLPALVPVVTASLAIYEFAVRQFIGRRIAQGRPISPRLWYVNTLIEISVITAVVIATRETLSNPVFALLVPAVAVYFVFIILSTLNLDVKICVFTGLLAALEYLGVVIYTLSEPPVHGFEPLFSGPAPYMARVFILCVAGIAAALVARELNSRLSNTLLAVAQRNRMQQSDQLKSQFLADVSHEIRTPLNTILGYAQLLATDSSLSPRQQRAMTTVGSSGAHLLAVLNEILDLSKIEAGQETLRPSDFDLGALVNEIQTAFEPRCAEKGVTR